MSNIDYTSHARNHASHALLTIQYVHASNLGI
jgi:hypothetical protein